MSRFAYAATILAPCLSLSCANRGSTPPAEPAPTHQSSLQHAESGSLEKGEEQAPASVVQADGSAPSGNEQLPEPAGANTSDGPSEQADSASDVSKPEVEAFAQCHVDLTRLDHRIRRRFAAGEPEEVLNEEYKERAQGIFAESLIDEKRYVEIARLAEVNPSLRQRLTRAVERLVEG